LLNSPFSEIPFCSSNGSIELFLNYVLVRVNGFYSVEQDENINFYPKPRNRLVFETDFF